MAWSVITKDDTLLGVGEKIRVSFTFARLPFTSPTPADIVEVLSANGMFVATGASVDWLDQLTSTSGSWKVEGSVAVPVTIAQLKAMIVSSMNLWYTWSVQVQTVEIAVGFRPNDLVPSASTAFVVVAVAVIVLVGWLTLKEAI